MSNASKPFLFYYPLKRKIVRDLKIVTEQVGLLEVEGTGYFNPNASVLDIFDRFGADVDFVRWNGTDIRPVLEVTGGMDEVMEAAIRYVAQNFDISMPKAA